MPAGRAAYVSLAFTLLGLTFALARPVAAQPTPPPAGAVADIKDANGKTVATAEIREDTGKVAISLV